MFKAAARLAETIEADASREKVALGFEARAESVAAEVKLVVKNTFFDVDISEDSDSDESEASLTLPSAFFNTTLEIDGWRRDYRRFRLGHAQGARGEVTEKEFIREALSGLDLRLESR